MSIKIDSKKCLNDDISSAVSSLIQNYSFVF